MLCLTAANSFQLIYPTCAPPPGAPVPGNPLADAWARKHPPSFRCIAKHSHFPSNHMPRCCSTRSSLALVLQLQHAQQPHPTRWPCCPRPGCSPPQQSACHCRSAGQQQQQAQQGFRCSGGARFPGVCGHHPKSCPPMQHVPHTQGMPKTKPYTPSIRARRSPHFLLSRMATHLPEGLQRVGRGLQVSVAGAARLHQVHVGQVQPAGWGHQGRGREQQAQHGMLTTPAMLVQEGFLCGLYPKPNELTQGQMRRHELALRPI